MLSLGKTSAPTTPSLLELCRNPLAGMTCIRGRDKGLNPPVRPIKLPWFFCHHGGLELAREALGQRLRTGSSVRPPACAEPMRGRSRAGWRRRGRACMRRRPVRGSSAARAASSPAPPPAAASCWKPATSGPAGSSACGSPRAPAQFHTIRSAVNRESSETALSVRYCDHRGHTSCSRFVFSELMVTSRHRPVSHSPRCNEQ